MAAKINWHRYGTKSRHCHPMYTLSYPERRQCGRSPEHRGVPQSTEQRPGDDTCHVKLVCRADIGLRSSRRAVHNARPAPSLSPPQQPPPDSAKYGSTSRPHPPSARPQLRRGARFTKYLTTIGWLGSRVVSVLDSGAEGPGTNRSRDAVG